MPAVTVRVPAVTASSATVIVLLPETASVIPPFAVRLFGMLIVPLVETNDKVPDDAPPIAKALESVMLPTEVMLRAASAGIAVAIVRVELP